MSNKLAIVATRPLQKNTVFTSIFEEPWLSQHSYNCTITVCMCSLFTVHSSSASEHTIH